MSIIRITGPAKSGKSVIASALRVYYLNQGCGVLLLDEDQKAADADLLAKIFREVVPEPLLGKITAEQVKWKKDSVVIAVGKQDARLAEFEKLIPGFGKVIGTKSFTISTTSAAKV